MTQDELAQANPDEQVQELGDGSVQDGSLQDQSQEPSGGDPLDVIEDVDTLRGEAKKFRSIAQRKSAKKEETPAAPAQEQKPADALTKQDFFRANSKKASKIATSDPEIAEHWDEISKLYVNRRGQEDPDDIVEDIKDAVSVWKARKPAESQGDAAAALQTTPGQKRNSAKPVADDDTPKPLWDDKKDITKWYEKSKS
jgi:hypothetical protein